MRKMAEYNACDPINPYFNCTRLEYVEYIFGPQTQPLQKLLLITFIYGFIYVAGIIGNLLACVVIARHNSMHTVTNWYLVSLAISDLIYLSAGLPAEVVLYWQQYPYFFGSWFCKMRAYISEGSTYVSVLTVVAFSGERYFAICHPFRLQVQDGFRRAVLVIAIVWTIGYMCAIPFGLMTNLIYYPYPLDNSTIIESALCVFQAPESLPLLEISCVLFFFIPILLIIYFYGRITWTMKLSNNEQNLGNEHHGQQARKKVIRMLVVIVLTFFTCWFLFHLQRLWHIYATQFIYYNEVNECLYWFTGSFYYIACTMNPVLYNIMSQRYRNAFRDVLCGGHGHRNCLDFLLNFTPKRLFRAWKQRSTSSRGRSFTTLTSSLISAHTTIRSDSINSHNAVLLDRKPLNLAAKSGLFAQKPPCHENGRAAIMHRHSTDDNNWKDAVKSWSAHSETTV